MSLTAIRAGLGLVPRWIWLLLAAAFVYHFALSWHAAQVKAHDQTVITARDAAWQKRLADERAAAIAWKGRFDAQLAEISRLQRKVTDEQNRRIAADATALRLRGAGAAAAPANCRPGAAAGLAGVASGHVAQPGAAADAPAAMPAGDGSGQWAIVPWNWLVDVVSERDAFRVEALGWRSYDAMVAGVWKRAQQQQQAADQAKGTKGAADAGR